METSRRYVWPRRNPYFFLFRFFYYYCYYFPKDEKDCKTDSVREKKKLFKDLQEGANSAGLYLHNIL